MSKLFITLTLLALSLNSFAEKVEVKVSLTPIGALEIESNKIMGSIYTEKNKIKAKKIFVPIKSLSTGIELRDKHLWRLLKEKKYKNITLRNLILYKRKGQGLLSLNGVDKKVIFSYVRKGTLIEADLKLSLASFDIVPPIFMGVSVNDDIAIHAKAKIGRFRK